MRQRTDVSRTLVAACLGGVDRDLCDALDLAGLVNHGVDCLLFAVFEGGGGFGLTEVDAAGEFADADDVDPVGDAVVLERRGFSQLRVEQARAHVGVKGECFADRQKGSALGLFFGREGFPLRPTDRAE